MDWLTFTIAVFAVYRTAILLSLDDGPGNLIRKTRQAVPRRSSLWNGIRCYRCCSFWAASVITASLWWLGTVPWVLAPLYGFALSGAAIVLNRALP